MPTYYGRGSYQSAPTGSGKCLAWDNTKWQASWPHILPVPSLGITECDTSGCGTSLAGRYCGNTINVSKRLCPPNPAINYLPVRDCGPNMAAYCSVSYRCCGTCPVIGSGPAIVDLTPAAFTWLADMDAGSIPVKVSW